LNEHLNKPQEGGKILKNSKTLWVYDHQLSRDLPGLQLLDKRKDRILIIEADQHVARRAYHKKRIVLILSAMRHFAKELETAGYTVDYQKCSNLWEGFQRHHQLHKPSDVIIHLPTDWHLRCTLQKWIEERKRSGQKVTILEESSLFLVDEQEWCKLLPENKPWKLDNVYRVLRKKYNVLMQGQKPSGGKWSWDIENRKPPKKGLSFVEPSQFLPDAITAEVIKEDNEKFPEHPGGTDHFYLPVTKTDANIALQHFIFARLGTFGDFQDAMVEQNPYMSHSLISSSLNIGLLHPLSVVQEVERAYYDRLAPLAAVEGFIRQILGWREYIRGVYLRTMPAYESVNYFEHHLPLPSFYWSGQTKMNCLHQCVTEVVQDGYNHHIQRLMILGNFANLVGVRPQEVSDWFNTMYTDSHDWVVLPNVLGMALYADGGKMSTKPYISSGQYINKMSNYCKSCQYDVRERLGEKACPFHSLYWNFLMRHKEKLYTNPRMKMMYRLLDNMSAKDREDLWDQGEDARRKVCAGEA